MEAREAIDGQKYNLPARGQQPEYRGAICQGFNHTREWVLFLVTDVHGKRKMTMVLPTQQIKTFE